MVVLLVVVVVVAVPTFPDAFTELLPVQLGLSPDGRHEHHPEALAPVPAPVELVNRVPGRSGPPPPQWNVQPPPAPGQTFGTANAAELIDAVARQTKAASVLKAFMRNSIKGWLAGRIIKGI